MGTKVCMDRLQRLLLNNMERVGGGTCHVQVSHVPQQEQSRQEIYSEKTSSGATLTELSQ